MNTRNMTHLDMSKPIDSMLVSAWRWHESTIPLMQSTYRLLTKLAEAEHKFTDKYYAISSNPNLSEAGKKSGLEEAFKATLAPAYRDLQIEGQSIKGMIASLKANSFPRVDPSDIAGAMVRSDIRRIFLGMAEMKRTIAIKANPSTALAAALLEFPPELLDLSAQDVEELTEAFGESAYPESAKQITELTDGLAMIKTMMDLAVAFGGDKLRASPAQVEDMIWGGRLPDEKRL